MNEIRIGEDQVVVIGEIGIFVCINTHTSICINHKDPLISENRHHHKNHCRVGEGKSMTKSTSHKHQLSTVLYFF